MRQFVLAPFTQQIPTLFMRGRTNVVQFPQSAYERLLTAAPTTPIPSVLAEVIKTHFGAEVHGTIGEHLDIRTPGTTSLIKASYEISLACDYDCPHCYLGPKPAHFLGLPERRALFRSMVEAGVVLLRMTGGEVLIAPHFKETYRMACQMGMVVALNSNASHLSDTAILDTLCEAPPYRLTISMYGATPDTYERVTRARPGSFERFCEGVLRARDRGLNLRLSIIVTEANAHEQTAMVELARSWGVDYHVYDTIIPTFAAVDTRQQSVAVTLRPKKAVEAPTYPSEDGKWTSCGAGTRLMHVDPHGRASICMSARDAYGQGQYGPVTVDLLNNGPAVLGDSLAEIADRLLRRTGGCSGCTLTESCSTCPPIARLSRTSGRPGQQWCQHYQ